MPGRWLPRWAKVSSSTGHGPIDLLSARDALHEPRLRGAEGGRCVRFHRPRMHKPGVTTLLNRSPLLVARSGLRRSGWGVALVSLPHVIALKG